MKKLALVGPLLAMGALMASQDSRPASQPEPETTTRTLAAGCSNELKAPKQQPQKPAPQPVTKRTVSVRPRPMGYGYMPVFRELPQRRRVKRGHSSWVILG